MNTHNQHVVGGANNAAYLNAMTLLYAVGLELAPQGVQLISSDPLTNTLFIERPTDALLEHSAKTSRVIEGVSHPVECTVFRDVRIVWHRRETTPQLNRNLFEENTHV